MNGWAGKFRRVKLDPAGDVQGLYGGGAALSDLANGCQSVVSASAKDGMRVTIESSERLKTRRLLAAIRPLATA